MHAGFRAGLSCRLQEIYPECCIPEMAAADDVLDDSCYRFCLAVRDFLWYRPSARFGLPGQRCVWLPDAQWLISSGPDLALAAKAGTNGESHNHNDCGSFLVCRGGKQLICDLGAVQYDAESFGPRRYERFAHSSRSHNVAMPAGCEQQAGAQYAAREVSVDTSAGRLSMELSACYDCPELERYGRVIEHDVSAGRVTIRDELRFSTPAPCTETFVSPFPIRLEADRAVFSSGETSAALLFDPSRFVPELLTETYLAHNTGEERTAYILHLNAPPADTRYYFVFSDSERSSIMAKRKNVLFILSFVFSDSERSSIMAKRKNVLFILSDQQRFDTVSAYGLNDVCRTPNIDALAADGMKFTNAFTPLPDLRSGARQRDDRPVSASARRC